MSMAGPEVLLVEDSPDDVEFFLHTFRAARFPVQVQVAQDGAEALDIIFGTGDHAERGPAGRLKVIVLDLKLPKVDGLEILRRLKGDLRTRHIPVVVLTSSLEERDLAESYQLGVNSYVVKPMEFDQYADSVRMLGRYWLECNATANGQALQ